MSHEEPTRSILLVGQHPDLHDRAATQLRSAGFRVDVIAQWFRDLPEWERGAPDLVIAHAQGPSDRFGLCQLLGKFPDAPPAVSIASGPSTVPGCAFSLRYPLVPRELDLVVRAALRGQTLASLRLIPGGSKASSSAPPDDPSPSSEMRPLGSRELSAFDSAGTVVTFEEQAAPPPGSHPSVSLNNAPIVPALSPSTIPLSSRSTMLLADDSEGLPPPPPFSNTPDVRPEPLDSRALLPVSDPPAASEEVPTLEPDPDPLPAVPPESVAPESLAPFEKITDDDDEVEPLTSHALEEVLDEELVVQPEVLGSHAVEILDENEAGSEADDTPHHSSVADDSGPLPEADAAQARPMRTWFKTDSAVELNGDLRGFKLADLLHHCAMGVKTGVITLQREGHRKRIYLRQGSPVYVDSLLREETLGAFLLKREVIDEEQHRIALAKMSSGGKRLGEVLIEMGVLKAKEAYRHLSEHIQSKLISAFGWNDGSYAFKELPRLPSEILGVPMNAPNLVVQGMRAHFNPNYLPADFPAFDSTGGLRVEQPAYTEEELALSPTAARIREELENGTAVDSLVEVVGAPVEQVMGVAYGLYVLQVIGFSNRPGTSSAGRPINAETSASIKLDGSQFETFNDVCDAFLADYLRLRPLDCFRVLGLDPDDDDDDDDERVREAFEAMRTKLHPEVFDPIEIQPVRIKVDELWTQIYHARKTLGTAAGRAKYRATLAEAAQDDSASSGARTAEQRAALAGEGHFLSGRKALSEGEFTAALEAFDLALEASPQEPSYLAHRAWTMYCSNPEANRQHAIAELNTTRSLDSSYPGVSYFLGRICLDDGANDIALGYFEMALRADPDFREAQQYRQLTKSKIHASRQSAAAPKKEGGRLSRLFRRKK